MDRREDLLLFLVSLAIAVVLWLQVQPLVDDTASRLLDVPLEQRDVPHDLLVIEKPDTVTLEVRGTPEEIDRVSSDDFVAFVSLRGAEAGPDLYDVGIEAPGIDLEVVPRRPRESITLERLIRKSVPVEVETSGAPPEGYSYVSTTALPDEVELSVVESRSESVQRVRVLLDLSDLSPGRQFSLPVEVLDADGRQVPLATVDPSTVTLSPTIAPAAAVRSLPISPQWTGAPAFGYQVVKFDLEPQQVEVRGSSAPLGMIGSVLTEPIDLTGLRADATLTVNLVAPEGSQLATKSVTVRIQVSRSRR